MHGVLFSTEVDPPAQPWVTPHVRDIAAARGVDLSTVVGHGVGGRIRVADLPIPTTGTNRSVYAVEADVTARGAGLPALLQAVVHADQLTNYPLVTRVADKLAYLPGVRDLNEDGITKLLANPASAKIDPATTLLVVTVPDALFAVPAWEGPVLALGAAIRRPAVVRVPGGGEGIGIRALAHLTLSVDPLVIDEATALAFLHAVAGRPA